MHMYQCASQFRMFYQTCIKWSVGLCKHPIPRPGIKFTDDWWLCKNAKNNLRGNFLELIGHILWQDRYSKLGKAHSLIVVCVRWSQYDVTHPNRGCLLQMIPMWRHASKQRLLPLRLTAVTWCLTTLDKTKSGQMSTNKGIITQNIFNASVLTSVELKKYINRLYFCEYLISTLCFCHAGYQI